MAVTVSGAFTPAGFADAIRAFGKDIDRPIINAIRRGLTYARTLAVDGYRQRGVMRRVFGVKPSGARALIKRTRVVKRGDVYTGGLTAKGLAEIQETGGRTKPHTIAPKNAKRLAFQTPAGLVVIAGSVQHPGATHPAMPSLRAAIEKAAPRMAEELDKGIQKAAALRKVA